MDRLTPVAIAIGSNLGDRRGHVKYAVSKLHLVVSDLRISSYQETTPVDVPGRQPLFLNAAATGATMLSAHELVDVLLGIERERGRERPFAGAARTLDLDLVLFGDHVIDEPGLIVPHRRFRERRFVLEPLAQIGSGMVDPVSGRTVGELLHLLNC